MGRERVLAIEHDWRIRKLIRANLEALGLEVQEAVNRQHGLKLLRETRPNLILLDLDFPDLDALQFLRELDIQLAGWPVPILLLSAEPISRASAGYERWIGYLLKPFSATALLEQVRKALNKW